MTYCVAIKVNDGLVFAADTRTAAGVDDVRTYNKLHVLEVPGERVFVILSAGNLATTQYVLAYARREMNDPSCKVSLRTVRHMFDAADYLGQLSVRAQKQSAESSMNVNVETTLILGGQIMGEDPSIYLIYPLGNCIAASPEMPFLQIGEIKYGKPILDRFVRPGARLEDAARCALVSLDSTMRSNISVGPPVDVAIMERDRLSIAHSFRLDYDTPYYAALKETWARQLENAVRSLPKFDWEVQQSLALSMQHQQAAQAPMSQQAHQTTPTWPSQQGPNGAWLMSSAPAGSGQNSSQSPNRGNDRDLPADNDDDGNGYSGG